jgi:solute carrier family 35 (adenosine 3'-phospho 5'-phosphosulfate transporter), member B2
MRKKYVAKDYFFSVVVTMGCALFILYPVILHVLLSPLHY